MYMTCATDVLLRAQVQLRITKNLSNVIAQSNFLQIRLLTAILWRKGLLAI
jgi:hypothetical protein